MHLDDQHFFVVRAVEDADPAPLGQRLHAPPEEVVVQLFGRRLLERIDLAALRIDARHHVLDRAVLAGRVHGLKDHQQRPGIVGIEQLLGLGQRRHVLRQDLLGQLLALRLGNFVVAVPGRVVILQAELFARRDAELLDDVFAFQHDAAPGGQCCGIVTPEHRGRPADSWRRTLTAVTRQLSVTTDLGRGTGDSVIGLAGEYCSCRRVCCLNHRHSLWTLSEQSISPIASPWVKMGSGVMDFAAPVLSTEIQESQHGLAVLLVDASQRAVA